MDNFESYKQAKILLEQEKFSDALKIYQKLLENNQEDAYLWYKIGELFENLVTTSLSTLLSMSISLPATIL